MSKRIRHSGKLIHQSLRVLQQQYRLILFPVLASLLVVLILTVLIRPLIKHEETALLIDHGKLHHLGWFYLGLLVFLFITHQVVFYFNAALTHCTQDYFKGKSPHLLNGIKKANQTFLLFFLWNLFGGTIGIILTLFYKHFKQYPLYKRVLLGLRFPVASYFSVPVITCNHTGPINTLKYSAQLMKKNWGTHLRANFGFIAFLMVARLLALLPLVIALLIGGKTYFLIGTGITVGFVLIISILNSATRTILCSALYCYAASGQIPEGFNDTLIRKAFQEMLHTPNQV